MKKEIKRLGMINLPPFAITKFSFGKRVYFNLSKLYYLFGKKKYQEIKMNKSEIAILKALLRKLK